MNSLSAKEYYKALETCNLCNNLYLGIYTAKDAYKKHFWNLYKDLGTAMQV